MKWDLIDSAPKDGTPILAIGVYGDGKVCYEVGVVAFERGGWFYQADGATVIEREDWGITDYSEMTVITHWMPLPEPPSAG